MTKLQTVCDVLREIMLYPTGYFCHDDRPKCEASWLRILMPARLRARVMAALKACDRPSSVSSLIRRMTKQRREAAAEVAEMNRLAKQYLRRRAAKRRQQRRR